MLTLRPHHALCIQKFTGHGYDETFTAHMTTLVQTLARAPETPVFLTRGCDVLCACCPHNRDGCASPDTVEVLDSRVMALCGLSCGETLRWDRLAALVRDRILSAGRLAAVCADCQWLALCKSTKAGMYHESGTQSETPTSYP